jgi:hypothetical protein
MNRRLTSERLHRALVFCSAGAAIVCIVELMWLRSALVSVSRLGVALLFLPWLAASASNLALWYWTLVRAPRSIWNQLAIGCFWVLSGAFTLAFLALYGTLIFA